MRLKICIFLMIFINGIWCEDSNITTISTTASWSAGAHGSDRAQNSTKSNVIFRVKRPLVSNYTRKSNEKIRFECEFEYLNSEKQFKPSDFTLYWVKNYQEILSQKKGYVSIIRKNMTSVLILRNLETFDSGSYMCIGEISPTDYQHEQLNTSSETTLLVTGSSNSKKINLKSKSKLNDLDYLLDMSNGEDSDDLSDEFPSLNPTIVENNEEKGFCEPYRGSICSDTLTSAYSIYSTSTQQQDLIEERLKTIIPLLTKNNLSKRCSTFAVPSLCLFAFPLCDKKTNQPKQICRKDCNQLQQDLCKNEYLSVKSLFESKFTDILQQQTSNNFLIDCNQLPPSSDSQDDCLPVVSMTYDTIQNQVVGLNSQRVPGSLDNKISAILNKECINGNGVDYRGTQSLTRNGFTCQRWDDISHTNSLLMSHNYCRNLNNDIEPWCYTGNPLKMKDYCYIPKCTDNSIIQTNSFELATSLTDKRLISLLYIVVPVVTIVLVLVFIVCIFCYCRRGTTQRNCQSEPGSFNGKPGSNLRMSNVSIGKNKKNIQKPVYNVNGRPNGSSKSSVISSNNNQQNMVNIDPIGNMETNPFIPKHNAISAYDNNFQHQMPPQPPQPQQFVHQPIQADVDFSFKYFSPNNIRLSQEIGRGRFGPVYLGEVSGSFATTSILKCTIKTFDMKMVQQLIHNSMKNRIDDLQLQTTSTPKVNSYSSADQSAAIHFMEQEFFNEISLYSSLKNRHIANLIGVFSKNKPCEDNQFHYDDDDSCLLSSYPFIAQCMIFESLNNGDLHEYLIYRANNSYSAPMMNPMGSQSNLSAVSSSIGCASSNYLNIQQQQRNIADFLYIGQQIASGMEYLASQNFILKDLATRNILMSDNLTVKISIDLVAQCKESYAKDYYKFQMKTLPVRWMSPESLLYGRYSQQSDVWSFGVCLWEIFNYGCQPYSGCTNPEAIEMIRDRQLLLIPDDCPQRAYALMLSCWNEIPMERPSFSEILNQLRNWENYYLFNNAQINNNNQAAISALPSMMPPSPLPLPLPIHLQQQQQQQQIQQSAPLFQMTNSYSNNSQNSKASSLLGNTISTGISTACSSPPPPPQVLPPSLQMNQYQNTCYSPSKAQYQYMRNPNQTTNIFASKFTSIQSTATMHQHKPSPPSSTITSSTISNSALKFTHDPTNSLRNSERNFNPNHLLSNADMNNHNSNFDL